MWNCSSVLGRRGCKSHAEWGMLGVAADTAQQESPSGHAAFTPQGPPA